ncbi:MAG: amidohydrolase family protein [Polyangiales bacterium]
MKRQPWLRRKKTAPELPLEPPIRLGNMSNGEFFHDSTPYEQRVRTEILRQAGEKARRLGVDRREFLASAAGMATSLSVLNMAQGCMSEDRGKRSSGFVDLGRHGDSVPGGGRPSAYAIPEEATLDCARAEDILNGKGEFIMDCQTHHIDEEGAWRETNPMSAEGLARSFQPSNGCTKIDLKDCVNADAYLDLIFVNSDTTVAVLSGFPAPLCTPNRTTRCGNSLDNDAMVRSRDHVNAIARSQRVVQHCQVNPTDELQLQLDMMSRIKEDFNCFGFKCYPEWSPTGKGWFLNDEASGIPMIERARALGSKIICAHKGIVFEGWDPAAGHPRDMGIVAVRYPDTHFVTYHSAIELGAGGEGPYNPNNTLGVDRLCRTAEEFGLKGKNLYAELGSCWSQVMNFPDKAQHVIGKLLKYLGEDNVVWGSECTWLGTPQPQIEAFRAFQITPEYQEKYGYPEMTPLIKAKVFGLNAARIYNIDVEETRCRVAKTETALRKELLDAELGNRRWAFMRPGGPRTRREFFKYKRVTNNKPFDG